MDPGVVPLLLFVLIGAGGVVLLFHDDPMLAGRRAAVVMGALAIAAVLTPMQMAPFRSDISIVHWSEFYHYLLATRYFHEVGYTGLYDATVVADHEDDPGGFDPGLEVRSLSTYAMGRRSDVLERADAVKAAFTPARWEAFKRDVAVFRDTLGAGWRSSRFQIDHGYNGTPVVTLLLGTLAKIPGIGTRTFILTAAWADTALMLVTALLVARFLGAFEGALLLFVWAVNPFADFMTIGGAYLRSAHLAALFAMALLFTRGRFAWAGAALGIATGLRVYPLFLAVGLAAQTILSPRRRELLRPAARCLAAFAIVLLVLILLSAFQTGPEGASPWLAYLGKLRLHADRLSYNVLSFQYPFFYAADHNAAAVTASWQDGRNLNWVDEATRTFAAHRAGYLVALLAAGAALALALRRGTPADGLFAGLILVFALQHLSHYDYAVLSIVPFLFPADRRVAFALFGCWMAACVVLFLPASAIVDLRFCLLSLLLTVWMALTVGLRARRKAATALL